MKRKQKKDWADKAVDKIIYDLSDRRGLRQEWDQIDDEIKCEIKAIWTKIIRRAKKKASK
jgi:hypothetical protein